MSTIFALWNTIVISAAVIAIVIIAIGLMIRVIEPLSALRRIGGTLGCIVILAMLPPLIVHLWHWLSLWQQIGIAVLGFTAALVWNRRTKPSRKGRADR